MKLSALTQKKKKKKIELDQFYNQLLLDKHIYLDQTLNKSNKDVHKVGHVDMVVREIRQF